MNLNEMNMDQASDAAIRISSAISFALEDKEVKALIDDISATGSDVEILDWIPKFLPKIVFCLLKRHREALYEIVGALTQKDSSEVGKMNAGEVIKVLKENWSVLTGFFTV